MKIFNNYFLLLLIISSFIKQQSGWCQIKLNHIQVIGSHNSYKIAIEPTLLNYLYERDSGLAQSLQYEHISLTKQLESGLRSLEIDVFNDLEGGYYSDPKGLDIVRAKGLSPVPFDLDGKLKLPGLKVFHVQDIDFRSSQLLFKDALNEMITWSLKNKTHTPVIITINTKDAKIPNLRDPLPFDGEALVDLDSEIKETIGSDRLITPDMVRGNFKNLEEAVLSSGWPALDQVKGKFLFVLDEGEERSDLYLGKFSGLKNAAMFVNKKEGHPAAAFMIVNNPLRDLDLIKKLVSNGYMVRTRADSDTKEARNNDYTRFNKAIESGAQVITTDYYLPSKLFQSSYKIGFEGDTYERIVIR